MTDNIIFNDGANHWQHSRSHRALVVPGTISTIKNYIFTVQENTLDTVKAHHGIATSAPWTEEDATTGDEFHCVKLGIWYDRWTPFDESNPNVHIIWAHTGAGVGFYYNRYNVSTDTVEINKRVIAVSSGVLPFATSIQDSCEIVKMDDGTLWCFVMQRQATNGWFILRKSVNNGSTWTTELTLGPAAQQPLAGIPMIDIAHILLTIAPGAPDNESPWFIIHDQIGNKIIAASYNGTTIVPRITIDADVDDDVADTYAQMSCSYRHNDRSLFLVYHARRPNNVGVEIRGVQLSDVNSSQPMGTNPFDNSERIDANDDIFTVGLSIDQVRGHLYVAYLRGDGFLGANMKAYWKKSLNSGTQWGAQNLSTDGGFRDLRVIAVPHSFGSVADLAALGFGVYDDDSNDWLMSDNDFQIVGAYTVRTLGDGGSDETVVDCTTGGEDPVDCIPKHVPDPCPRNRAISSGGHDTSRSSPHSYPNYVNVEQVYISFGGKTGSPLNNGDQVVGVESGCKGIFAGVLIADNRMLVTSIQLGPNGMIFLPNERIEKVGDPTINLTVNSIPAPSAFLLEEELNDAI